jgi:hypothetical protein
MDNIDKTFELVEECVKKFPGYYKFYIIKAQLFE